MYKKLLSFISIFTIVLLTMMPVEASEFSATEYQPYQKMDYNLDIVSKEDWENIDVGEYPIDVHSVEWSQLSSCETAAACNMPKEYAQSLTTAELVDYAVNYPFLMDILAYDNIADGINHLVNKSFVFEELFSRADCYDELLAEYLDMQIDYIEVADSGDVCETNYDAELFIEIYMGLNYDLLSENQAEKFVGEYGNKFSNMNSECQESVLSTLFYDAIEEKIGVVPEEAVPESIATKFVDSVDVYDASLTSASLVICGICGATLSYKSITVYVRNLFPQSVYVYQWVSGGYNADDIAKLDKYIADYYPSFSKVRSASSKYNCHSYAWYSTDATNSYWIDDPSPIYSSGWVLWQAPMRNLQAGDRITFWSDGKLFHSSIINCVTTCTSKLGHYGVYQTTISEMESYYGSSTTQSYIP